MARDFFINGETMVYVKGNTDTPLSGLTELGLASEKITCTPVFKGEDLIVDAWGDVPVDVQFMLAELRVSMTLVHIDRAVLDIVIRESMAGASSIGSLPRAGTRMGGGVPRFVSGNHYLGLNLSSPVGGKPWRFFFAYLFDQQEIDMGTKRSFFVLNWRVIPYTIDPYNGGLGALGTQLWDHTLDT